MTETKEYEVEPGKTAKIEISKSPAGKDCVSMTIDGKEWILLAAMEKRDAFDQGLHLHQNGIKSRQGPALNWRKSIAEKKIVPFADEVIAKRGLVGVYVPAEKFDDFVNRAMSAYSS